jgi:hypothetical protein
VPKGPEWKVRVGSRSVPAVYTRQIRKYLCIYELCVGSYGACLRKNALILLIGATVASEKDGFMSETMIKYRNLPNPHLFEPLFCTRA